MRKKVYQTKKKKKKRCNQKRFINDLYDDLFDKCLYIMIL